METIIFEQAAVWRDALVTALAAPSRHINWFDVDLSESIAHEARTAERLKALLTESPLTRICLLLHDDAFFWRHCHRLISLQATYGHAFEIRLTDESDRRPQETFLLTDTAVVRRFHPDAHRGELSEDGRARALCRQNFHSMWQRAQPAQAGRRLGI